MSNDEPNRRNIALSILFLIYAVNTMDRQIISVLAEPIKNDLLLSDTQLGILSGLTFAIFYSFCSIPMAWAADRFGRVLIITLACIFWSIGSIGGGFSGNFAQLALSRVGVAVGEAGGTAPSHSLLGVIFPPEQRARAFSIFSMGGPLGGLLAIILCGAIAERYGWRSAVIAVSTPGILFALLLFLFIREPTSRTGPAAAPPGLRSAFRAFFGSRVLRLVSLASALSATCVYGASAWLPAYLMRAKGMTLGDVALYYSFVIMGATGAGLYVGSFADRLASRHAGAHALLPGVGLLMGVPFLVGGVVAADWPTTLALMAGAMLASSIYLGPMIAVVQTAARDEQRSTFAALFMLIVNLIGAGVGPLLVGAVSDALADRHRVGSLSYGLLALAPIMATAALLHLRIACLQASVCRLAEPDRQAQPSAI